MQSAWSKIWTRIAMSISYDDNYFTTGTSKKGWYTVKQQPTNRPNQLALEVTVSSKEYGCNLRDTLSWLAA